MSAALQKASNKTASSKSLYILEDDPEIPLLRNKIRSKTLPYMDSVMKVRASVSVLDSLRETLPQQSEIKDLLSTSLGSRSLQAGKSSLSGGQSGAHIVTAATLKRRYPRFCETLKFNNSMVAEIVPRSDVWLSEFMEECYDAAFSESLKEVSQSRQRKRCGLFMGAVDAFSMVVSRILARTFRCALFLLFFNNF